jgi:uncharacterized protein (DUF2062 family)
VVFKRRKPLGWLHWMREMIYPRGGFGRATRYVMHRMRRLPDQPHRIARGVLAGAFVSVLPLFGVQFVTAALCAWAIRGNVLAAMLATFLSNPVTTPFIAVGSIELGHWMLGMTAPLDVHSVWDAFAGAGADLWLNLTAPFADHAVRWDRLGEFLTAIYWPYLVGSLPLAIALAVALYYAALPLVRAYQAIRARKAGERAERRRATRPATLAAAAQAAQAAQAAVKSATAASRSAHPPPNQT